MNSGAFSYFALMDIVKNRNFIEDFLKVKVCGIPEDSRQRVKPRELNRHLIRLDLGVT